MLCLVKSWRESRKQKEDDILRKKKQTLRGKETRLQTMSVLSREGLDILCRKINPVTASQRNIWLLLFKSFMIPTGANKKQSQVFTVSQGQQSLAAKNTTDWLYFATQHQLMFSRERQWKSLYMLHCFQGKNKKDKNQEFPHLSKSWEISSSIVQRPAEIQLCVFLRGRQTISTKSAQYIIKNTLW